MVRTGSHEALEVLTQQRIALFDSNGRHRLSGLAWTAKPSLCELPEKGRSARIVVTMGMPAFVYRWYFGAHSLKNLERNLLRFVGFKPVNHTVLGLVEMTSNTAPKPLAP